MSDCKRGSICAIYSCNNYKQQKDSKSFFRMPKNIHILMKWIAACRRIDLDNLVKILPPEYFYNTYVVCSDHFEIQCFRNKNLFSQGLFPGSVPTLNLDNVTITLKRDSQNIDYQQLKTIKIKTELELNPDNVDTSIPEILDLCASNSGTEDSKDSSDLIAAVKIENSNLKIKTEMEPIPENIDTSVPEMSDLCASTSGTEDSKESSDLIAAIKIENSNLKLLTEWEPNPDNTDTSIPEMSDLCATTSSTEDSKEASNLIKVLKMENSNLKLKIEKYRNQLRNKSSLLCKYRKRNTKLKEEVVELKKMCNRTKISNSNNGISVVCKQFIHSQFQQTSRHKMGR